MTWWQARSRSGVTGQVFMLGRKNFFWCVRGADGLVKRRDWTVSRKVAFNLAHDAMALEARAPKERYRFSRGAREAFDAT